MARLAGAHLWCRPGSERRVLAALARLVIEERGEAAERTAGDIKGYNGFAGALASVDLAKIESSTGVPLEQLRNAAVRLAKASRALAFFSSGVTGPDRGSVAYLFNLFLAAGKIGRKGCGVNPLAGICNIVGATDMGAAPDMLPGYLRVPNEPAAARFRAVWGAEIEAGPGTSPLDLLRKRDPGLKALLVADHDEEINLDSDRLRELDFTAYVGSYANPFLEYAHVVFPSATHAEADGTYTNTERRIQLNLRKTEPRFESRPEWRIYADLAERLAAYAPTEITADIAHLKSDAVGNNSRAVLNPEA